MISLGKYSVVSLSYVKIMAFVQSSKILTQLLTVGIVGPV